VVDELGGWREIRRPEPPPEEVQLHGRRHSLKRDRAAISHHYDVSNAFYEMVLGPSLTYSCAVFHSPDDTLEQAQANKYELICRKLGLEEGMRLLDVGCGWGGRVPHAAREHGVKAVGVTISYFGRLQELLRPGGRLLNHGVASRSTESGRVPRRSFVNRCVFPDGELHEVGKVVSAIQAAGFEVRHSESLREHYALTLRRWVANLEANWDAAVAEVGPGRARVWRMYMAGGAVNFDVGRTQIHQILAVEPTAEGRSGLPLRPVVD
jgi:cyclopropane-fatty-acyl-phospholipid synthase